MTKTSRNIFKRMIERIELRQLAGFSIACAILSGCVGAPVFPTETVWELDRTYGACGKWKIVNGEKLILDFVTDVPADQCPDAIFGFTSEDAPKVLDWVADRAREARAKK